MLKSGYTSCFFNYRNRKNQFRTFFKVAGFHTAELYSNLGLTNALYYNKMIVNCLKYSQCLNINPNVLSTFPAIVSTWALNESLKLYSTLKSLTSSTLTNSVPSKQFLYLSLVNHFQSSTVELHWYHLEFWYISEHSRFYGTSDTVTNHS